jgi:hypothetical protein
MPNTVEGAEQLDQSTGERDVRKFDIAKIARSEAYAAVAPNISTLLAVVKRPRQMEKIAE